MNVLKTSMQQVVDADKRVTQTYAPTFFDTYDIHPSI